VDDAKATIDELVAESKRLIDRSRQIAEKSKDTSRKMAGLNLRIDTLLKKLKARPIR
jgi:hypothetical protein